jgi:hypothetical protein
LSKDNATAKSKKKIRVKKVKDTTKENDEPKDEPKDEVKFCPRRRKGDTGDCEACGS